MRAGRIECGDHAVEADGSALSASAYRPGSRPVSSRLPESIRARSSSRTIINQEYMPESWADFAMKPGVIGAGLCSIAAIAFGGIAFKRYLRSRPTPDELERRRREAINAAGKICDGEIIEIEGPSIIYSYSVAGVEYTAAQDVTSFES